MFAFTSNYHLTLSIAISVANAFVLCFCCYKLLHVFQLSGYQARNFSSWVFSRRSKFYIRLFALSFLSFGSMLIVSVLFEDFVEIISLSYLGLIFYFYLTLVFINNTQREPVKVSLKFTARIKRLIAVMWILLFFVSLTVMWVGVEFIPHVRFSLIAFIPMLLPVLILVCHFILLPLESIIKLNYLNMAKRKLKNPEYQSLIRIGITGSWGKTSTKNILAAMLREKYQVVASPASFNTPTGFSKTINNVLTDGDEVLIMEMGARYINDIKYLSSLFKPHHAIITGIGVQHLETFKTIENIKRTKSDLIRALPAGGIAVLNGDNEKCREAFNESILVNKFISTVNKTDGGDGSADNIKMTNNGAEFTLLLRGQRPVKCKTKLLGIHNIQNILMCAIMANKLGITPEQISGAIEKLEPTPHRLELVKTPKGVLILDDSYNASVTGTKAALDVLALFRGKKIVMTPGLVELGAKEEEENFKFGARLADAANAVIIVGETNKTDIANGLLSRGFAEKNIFYAGNIEDAKNIYTRMLKPGDVLLIENDLPDNYS